MAAWGRYNLEIGQSRFACELESVDWMTSFLVITRMIKVSFNFNLSIPLRI
jgi:hypothetical protein